MKMFSKAAALGTTAMLAGLVGATGAYAQIEQITVTSQKREQTLQEVPIAVSVVQAETLENAQIVDAIDLQSVVPSLRVSQLERSSNATFIIRGQGNGANNPGIEPSVAVYIDGVFRSRAGTALSDLNGIERIEVLRGPQSTLFGKNATAGVVSIITESPQFEFGGTAEITLGNYNSIITRGSVTGPLSDNLAFSLSGSVNQRDGYYENLGPAGDFNNRDRWSLRGQLLYTPSDTFSLRVIADHDEIEEACCGTDRLLDGPAGPVLRGLLGGQTSAGAGFNYEIATDFANENRIENSGISAQADWSLSDTLSLSSITSYRMYEDFIDYEGDFTTLELLGANVRGLDVDTFSQEFRLTGEWGDRAFFLLGAYYSTEDMTVDDSRLYGSDTRAYVDILTGGALGGLEAATGFAPGSFFADGGGTTFTAEQSDEQFQIFSQVDFNLTDRLVFTAGLAYFESEKEVDFLNVVRTNPFSDLNLVEIGLGSFLASAGVNPNDPVQVGAFAAAQPAVFGAFVNASSTFNAVGLANGGVLVGGVVVDPLTGLPLANPLLDFFALGLQPLGALTPFPNSVEDGRTSDSDTPYTVRLAFDATDRTNIYGSFSRGFKASSWNLTPDTRPNSSDIAALRAAGELAADNALGAPTIVNTAEALGVAGNQRFARPEITETFEIGFKTRFDFGSLDVAYFDQTVTDFQSSVFQGAGFAVINAGEQSATGLEFDAVIAPPSIEGLTFTMSGIWMDAQYDDFQGAPVVSGGTVDLADGVQDGTGDLSGQTVAGIPDFAGSFGVEYIRQMSFGELMLRGDWQYESEVRLLENLPESISRQVSTINASIGVNFNNGVETLLWARNLNEDEYYTSGFPTTLQAGSFSVYPNQPRTYGLTVRTRF
ncbi:TonB-dependent receptor [Maricaulis sp.]|uniref:TonB-dependent receptor n=1 Tax=Maricaulis sp. TaxID=1486257 RepID=UPI002602E0F4|nr:TonB-dependent receptor [Maricaulis sp.]